MGKWPQRGMASGGATWRLGAGLQERGQKHRPAQVEVWEASLVGAVKVSRPEFTGGSGWFELLVLLLLRL